MNEWKQEMSPYLTQSVREALGKMPEDTREIRIRSGKPVAIQGPDGCRFLKISPPTPEEVERMALAMLEGAPSSRAEELRSGYVTLPGGHRAGFCGRAVITEGKLSAVEQITFLSLRVARQVPGAARNLHPYLFAQNRAQSMLLLSRPGGGKTTMLRDAARFLSEKGATVCLVDERSELAACRAGVPALDVGENTDVLDGCPKAQGMRLMLRAMSPQVIVTDELGGAEDAQAVEEMLRCGVAVVTSAHASSFQEAKMRPGLGMLLERRAFEHVAVIPGVGETPQIFDGGGRRLV